MSHYNALERIWEENESNQATYYYDSVRHYFPKSPREKGWDLERRVKQRRSFEQHTPLDGWKTSKALLISDPTGEHSYGLCYNPDLDYWYGTKGGR